MIFKNRKFQIIIATTIILSSCGEGESKKGSKDEVITTDTLVVQADTIGLDTLLAAPTKITYSLTPEDNKSLARYLNKNEVKSLNASLETFSNTEVDSLVITSFLEILRISDSLKTRIVSLADYELEDKNGDFYPFTLQTELAGLEKSIPGFVNTCVAECTAYDCVFEFPALLHQASTTEGTMDDEFFGIIAIAEKYNISTTQRAKAWFTMMWDYGGATDLGNNIHLEFLTKSKAYLAKHITGAVLLQKYQLDAFEDVQHGIYMNKAVVVNKELKAIIDLKVFTPSQNEVLTQLYNKIKSGDYSGYDAVGGILQFDCETGDCNFGG